MADLSVQVVAFDCYGTIIDFDEDHFIAAMAESARAQSLPVDGKTLWDSFLTVARAMRAKGEFPYFRPFRETWPIIVHRAYEELELHGDGAATAAYLRQCMASAQAYAEVKPALAALRPYYRLTLLSNADDDFLFSCLRHNQLDNEFEALLSSEMARCTKPNPAIFHQMAHTLATPPAAMLYVGDSPSFDIAGARRAGMPVAWVNRQGTTLVDGVPQPDVEVKSLTELAALLLAPLERDKIRGR